MFLNDTRWDILRGTVRGHLRYTSCSGVRDAKRSRAELFTLSFGLHLAAKQRVEHYSTVCDVTCTLVPPHYNCVPSAAARRWPFARTGYCTMHLAFASRILRCRLAAFLVVP